MKSLYLGQNWNGSWQSVALKSSSAAVMKKEISLVCEVYAVNLGGWVLVESQPTFWPAVKTCLSSSLHKSPCSKSRNKQINEIEMDVLWDPLETEPFSQISCPLRCGNAVMFSIAIQLRKTAPRRRSFVDKRLPAFTDKVASAACCTIVTAAVSGALPLSPNLRSDSSAKMCTLHNNQNSRWVPIMSAFTCARGMK